MTIDQPIATIVAAGITATAAVAIAWINRKNSNPAKIAEPGGKRDNIMRLRFAFWIAVIFTLAMNVRLVMMLVQFSQAPGTASRKEVLIIVSTGVVLGLQVSGALVMWIARLIVRGTISTFEMIAQQGARSNPVGAQPSREDHRGFDAPPPGGSA